MSINEINPGNSLKTGVDSFTGLPGRISDINRELFGQPLSKAPNSILGGIPMNPLLEADDRSISATQTKARSGASSVYEDESGTFPIDRAAQQVGKALMDNTITAPVPSGDRVDRTERYDELLNPNPSNLSATVSWRDLADNETYWENFLPSGQLSGSDRLNHPFVGVIDTGFNGQNPGTQVINVIQRVGHQFPDWLADSVGSGTWSESLVNFVDAAKASKRSSAVINLSFDLTQINLDGSISTRFELTTAEKEALKYAQANGVLVVVSAGNQGGAMSALGQASQDFDNVIAVGATEGGQRADYSSYGAGLDFVASGQGKGEAMGTSLAAARVTGSIAQIWDANPKLDYRQVIQTLESTAIDLQKPGWDSKTGFGQLNTSAAIDLAEDLASQPQSLSNSQLQNTIKSDRADQDLHNAIVERESLVGQKSNGAIPSERPNRVLEGDGTQPEPTPNVTSSSSGETSSLDSPLKNEPGVPLQYNEQVKQWQQRMQERGWNIADDGFYGSQSAQIARQFQQEKGLGVDGIVGPDTWAATFDTTNVGATNNVTNSPSSGSPSLDSLLKYEPGVPLKYDEQVKQWQQRMSDRGWNIDVDGLYGPQSAQIARQFQQEKGLAVDGIVGPDTWAATFDTNNATSSIPTPPNTSTPLSDPAQKLLNVARSYIGVREQGGNNRGRQVEEFQRAIGGAAAEPWCMSFAQYCIKAAESATQANSQVTQSEHCLTVWNGSPSELRRSRPEPGSLVIWRHGNSRSGHVGIVEAVNSDGTFTTIEGNTSDSSGINREGDGVYRKQRDMDGAGDMRVVGFLKVFPDYIPADASEPSSSVATSVATMSNLEKLEEAFKRALSRVDDEAGRQLEELLTPENIAIMAGTMALWAASHGTPIGWIVDGVLIGVGIFTIGLDIFEAGKDIFEFATGALGAETEADLDQAGQHLAEAIATVGIEVVAGILTRKGIEGGAPERPTLPEQPKPLDPTADNPASPPPFGIVHTPSDRELNDAVESSHDATDKVADKEQMYKGKPVTYATTANGQIFRNGWAENPELADAVENFMYEHDIGFVRSGTKDNGLDGRAKASHAERKAFMDVLQREPDTRIVSIGVNAPLCNGGTFAAACTDFFNDAARVTGKTIVITEMERGKPNVRKTHIFRPDEKEYEFR